MLLIEFDQNKSFTFDAFTSASTPGPTLASSGGTFSSPSTVPFMSSSLINPSNPRSLQHLLVLLTLSFPRLKIIWSSSPYQTAEIFAELKKNNPEPDPIRAVQMGLDFDISSSSAHPADIRSATGIEHRTFNLLPQDMLRAVPGVTPRGLERLILETSGLHQVGNMDVDELEPLVGKEAAGKMARFFRRSVFDDEAEQGV